MKNIAVVILVVLIVAVMLLYLVSFQVRQTESALILTFGQSTRQIQKPGWNWKWPAPIQTLVRYDSRPTLFEGVEEETTTKGGEPIIVQTYVIWRIADAKRFREAVRDTAGAEKLLKSRLRDAQNKVIGRHYFSELVNTDRQQIKFGEIENEMVLVCEPVKQAYGIGIESVGIKMLKVSEKVTEDVFARMRADRKRKTEATLAQGSAEAMRIKSDADSKITELLAAAEARAKAIRGSGDAEAAQYYKMLDADPEFAMFLREIETLKKTLKERTTVVLPADAEPFKLLKQMPQIEPKQ
ncbi:MAG: protease modulator HflC [Phycisphaerae bacterium]|jgi:membrane protease subunit HflC|nr:protease modulator HflC [Phycisphaerae bacterium]